MKTFILNTTIFIFSLFLGFNHAEAHRVNLFAWIEGDTVYVESTFSGGKKVKAGKILVNDPQGNELLRGTTDGQGNFSFKVPVKTDLKIVLIAGTGHRAEWTIPVSEIEMPAAEKKQIQNKGPTVKNIIIGLACILGLTGIATYIRRRTKKA